MTNHWTVPVLATLFRAQAASSSKAQKLEGGEETELGNVLLYDVSRSRRSEEDEELIYELRSTKIGDDNIFHEKGTSNNIFETLISTHGNKVSLKLDRKIDLIDGVGAKENDGRALSESGVVDEESTEEAIATYRSNVAVKPDKPSLKCENCVSTGGDPAALACTSMGQTIGCFSCMGNMACTYSQMLSADAASCIGFASCQRSSSMKVAKKACNGFYSCSYSPSSLIGFSSCHGYFACYRSLIAKIQKYSCIGSGFIRNTLTYPAACAESLQIQVGPKSCHGSNSCNFSPMMKVGTLSCIGYFTCNDSSGMEVKSGSCVGDFACENSMYTFVGNGSCRGVYTCNSIPFSKIGSWSCSGEYACNSYIPAPSPCTPKLHIGAESCVGPAACSYNCYTVTVGSNSCNAEGACFDNFGAVTTVGSNSCNEDFACYYNDGDLEVGNDSCNAPYACNESYIGGLKVGSGSCNQYEACIGNNNVVIDDGACNCVGCCSGYTNCRIYANTCNTAGSCDCVTITSITSRNDDHDATMKRSTNRAAAKNARKRKGILRLRQDKLSQLRARVRGMNRTLAQP